MNETPTEVRDWLPGDGLRCRFASISPIPCGPPVKTRITKITGQGQMRGRTHVRIQPLCVNHASYVQRSDRATTASITSVAKKMATERLIAEHWADYQRYLDEFAAKLAEDAAARGADHGVT